ncbi:nucleoside hydrolase [Maricaulis sp.]|uniref:nucleoside hydrolase n=1 Tax=unclassified Maricaulis TaxID=2632371 RepID=UPI001B25529A|nr:nucleoside hydrolase [Maricaulis sp.]MBO6798488.1 nucleoside hydrolase [Maricaulis sp.]
MTRSIIIDCDPGVDDCIALLAALGAPDRFDLKAITVVAGNVPVETCARNARGVLALAGREDIPVYAGCDRPMRVDPEFAEHIHGASGLGDARLPEASVPVSTTHAVDYLCDTLSAAEPGSITLVITGPMTNFATALKRDASIMRGVRELVIMGGAAIEGGNITAHAEFNIYADPDAAKIVLESGCATTLIGLDATLQIRCTPPRMQRLEASGHPACHASAAMISHVNRIYGEVYGADGAALHDPCTIGYLLDPGLFSSKSVSVTVTTSDDEKRGNTALGAECANGVNWVTGLDDDALFDLLVTSMERL